MKHSKEWHTCDRCGAEIEKGILCGNSITKNGILNVTYDLCYKCMEDFEEFMRKSNVKDCSTCKYCDEDFIFDKETGEEYPFYECQKGNDTSLDYECKDFERFMKNDCQYQ